MSGKNNLEFDYDAFGRRIAKHVYNQENDLVKSTYYLLDAQGNQLSVYEHVTSDTTAPYQLTERVIYGSSRLGMNATRVDLLNDEPEEFISLELGNKLYELSNHLGSVLTTISDIKVPESLDNITVSSYRATIVSTADYSPFGVQLDGRTVSAETYRFGYQGSEKDDEVKGSGNSYTTEFRLLDPRLGRWLSIDPLAAQFPWQSPYVSMDNNPVNLNDVLGESTLPGAIKNDPDSNAPLRTANGKSNLSLPKNATNIQGSMREYSIPVDVSAATPTSTLNPSNNGSVIWLKSKSLNVESFEINGVKYSACYTKSGRFNGYWNDSGGRFGGVDGMGNYSGNSYESRTNNRIDQSDVDQYIKNRFAESGLDDIPADDLFAEELCLNLLADAIEGVLGAVIPVSTGPGGIPDPKNSPRRQKLFIRHYLQHVAGPGSQCTHANTETGYDGNCFFTVTTYTIIQYFGTNSNGKPVFKQTKTTVDSRNVQMAEK